MQKNVTKINKKLITSFLNPNNAVFAAAIYQFIKIKIKKIVY